MKADAMITDDEIMSDIRELSLSTVSAEMRRNVDEVERNGAYVTLYRIVSTGSILVITSVTQPPPISLIREAYLADQMQNTGGTA